MSESATTFVCSGSNDPIARFNRCQLPPWIEIAGRFGDLGETDLGESLTDVLTTTSPRAWRLDQYIHTGPVEEQHQFGIELSSHIRARSGITCLTVFLVKSLLSSGYAA